MNDWKKTFEGKKITLMGLGLLGRGVGDAKFLAECGAELIVTDLKSEEELASSLEQLASFSNITYRLGGHTLEDFRDRDFILKAAGVPLDSSYIKEAEKNHIPVKMSASWFIELAQIPFVGVTGTRGKTTVTHLLHTIMQSAGMHVLLGGNIRGVSTLALLPEVKSDSIALMELDSWQCQGLRDQKQSPDVAVFTTFMPDHLNYYHNDTDAYLADKAEIFLHQKPEDTLIIGSETLPLIKEKYGRKIVSRVVVAEPGDFPKGWHIQILGVHNLLNAMCAIQAARALGIDDEVIKDAVGNFNSVQGRLQLVREVKGISFYNDTAATTPEATIAGFRAIPGSRAILIMGGADKGLDMEELAKLIPVYTKKVVFLSGTGTEKLMSAHPEFFANAPVYDRLQDAVRDAFDSAAQGDLILFSPAFASFGMFKNEYDRGDQFVEIVNAL